MNRAIAFGGCGLSTLAGPAINAIATSPNTNESQLIFSTLDLLVVSRTLDCRQSHLMQSMATRFASSAYILGTYSRSLAEGEAS